MKTISYVILILTLISLRSYAQMPNRGCGTPIPSAQYDSLFQQKVIDYLNNSSEASRIQSTYQIPVIIHVIHGGEAIGTFPNIAQGQINSQIKVLNDDYAGVGFNSGTYPATAFQTYATNALIPASSKDGLNRIAISNTGITFCLAAKDSLGNFLSEPGIDRRHWNTISGAASPSTYTSGVAFDNFINGVIKPATIWSPNKYLNIWLTDVNSSLGLVGVTTFPPMSGLAGLSAGGTATTDGVWCWTKIFGSQNIFPSGTYIPTYNLGRTVTHEISHYLGLRHIWGDSNCGTDYCNDTPPQQAGNYSVATYPYLPNNCAAATPPTGPNGIMFMNFTDYTDDAGMYMFTDQQKIRMQTALTNSPYRNLLGTNGSCFSLTPNFSLSSSIINIGQSVNITDLSTSTNTITIWSYSCTAASPPSSNLQNPILTFNTPGIHTITLTVTASGVSASVTKTIQVLSCPTSTVSLTTSSVSCNSLCNGVATINATGGAPFTYSWTPAVGTGSVVNNLCAGNYTCVVTNSCGISSTKTVVITQPTAIVVTIVASSPTVCLGNSTTLSSSISGGTPSYVYNWSAGATTSNITVTPTISPSTGYTLTVSDSHGCSSTKTFSVNVVNTPVVSISSPSTSVCMGYTMAVVANGATSYAWSNGATTNTTNVQPFTNTSYSVVGSNGSSCKDTAYLNIIVLPLPTVSASASTTLACIGQTINIIGSGNAINYLWQPNNLFGANQNVQITAPTTYTLYGQGSNGCVFLSTVFVNAQNATSIIPVSTPSMICVGDSSTLSVIGGNVPLWNANPIPNTIVVAPSVNSTYTVNAIDMNGCASIIAFTVEMNADCDAIIYNGFTPNGDGLNDFWVIDNIEKYPNNKVHVFNRWGNKIFSTTNYDNVNNRWDGKTRTETATSGTYFYIILNAEDKLIKKGWIEITK